MANEIKIHSQKSTPVITVLCLCLPVFLTSCSSDNTSDLQEYVTRIKARPKGRIKPLPEITPYETYLYQVSHLRDPFTPFIAEEEASLEIQDSSLHPDLNRKREELEQYSLDSLSFIGHIKKKWKNLGINYFTGQNYLQSTTRKSHGFKLWRNFSYY